MDYFHLSERLTILGDALKFADYAEYHRLGLPIGSGVTDAACKTIFTRRLKLSGIQWTRPGAQVILQLRIVLLSGIRDQC